MQIKKAYPKKTRFVVWGYGVTGQALVRVLAERGYPVVLVENKPESEFAGMAEEIARLKKSGVKFLFGGAADLVKLISREADVFSPSPGIAVPKDLLNACADRKIQIAGEIEIAYRLVQGRIIAVTGTDGKTTTATLIHHLLSASGLQSHLLGNVGSPFIGLAGQTNPEHWLVVEVSSYQLESIRLFRPYIAVLLNIAEDHLERHGDMRVYIRMKGRVFEKQHANDHAVVNFDDPTSLQAYGQAKSVLHGFSLAGRLPGGAWLEGTDLILDKGGKNVRIIGSDEFNLIGEHNRSNALAAILACHLAGCEIEKMRGGLKTFRGLPHRLEPVTEVNNILWVNDSKATNVHSTINALNSFERPIVLLLGGYDKGLDVTPLIPCIQRHVRHVVLFGATRNRFKKAFGLLGYSEVTVRKTLQEACSVAKKIAAPGDIVLLSPGSSSFDQFKSYIHRGEVFRKWVETKVMGKEK